jgi:hypothetical protein
VGAGDHYNALVIQEVVDRVWEAKQRCPPDVIQHCRELFGTPLDERERRSGGTKELEAQARTPSLVQPPEETNAASRAALFNVVERLPPGLARIPVAAILVAATPELRRKVRREGHSGGL